MRWLLNLAYMTTGGYPDRVPPAHLIPPAAFASAEDVGRFVDVAPQAGLDLSRLGRRRHRRRLRRRRPLRRRDVEQRPLRRPCTSSAATATARSSERASDARPGRSAGRPEHHAGRLQQRRLPGHPRRCAARGWSPQRKSLLRNNCDGTFTDVTAASGLARPATSTQTAVWTDVNNDGFARPVRRQRESRGAIVPEQGATARSRTSRRAAGVDRPGFTKGVAAADYDNDGWPDLYVSNFGGANVLYRQQPRRHVHRHRASRPACPGRGRGLRPGSSTTTTTAGRTSSPTSYFTSVDESARTYLELPHNATTLKLYKNLATAASWT